MPTNDEWSGGWVCMGCCGAGKVYLIRQRHPLEKDLYADAWWTRRIQPIELEHGEL